jgi:hypothetical protein
VMINTRKVTLQVGETYILNKNMVDNVDFLGGGGLFWNDPANISFTNTIKTGKLKITRLDLSNSIISGTFWFDAVNSTGEIVKVREGRFDKHY